MWFLSQCKSVYRNDFSVDLRVGSVASLFSLWIYTSMKPQQQSQNVFQKECLADTSASILSKSFQIILQIHTL